MHGSRGALYERDTHSDNGASGDSTEFKWEGSRPGVSDLIELAEVTVLGALTRQESRGAHARRDRRSHPTEPRDGDPRAPKPRQGDDARLAAAGS